MEDLPDDLLNRVLSLLDGRSLAAVSSASSSLRAAATRPELWLSLCKAAWPGLPDPPASPGAFFSDALGFPPAAGRSRPAPPPTSLISIIELAHNGRRVLSKAVRTETRGRWFGCSPFRVDAVALDEPVPAPGVGPEGLTLDWVLLEPGSGRAVNLSSRRPVEVERRWYTGEILVRFGARLDGSSAAVAVVALGEETMEVREARLMVEDSDGAALNGKDALAALSPVLAGDRRRDEDTVFTEFADFTSTAATRKEIRLKGRGGGAITLRRLAAAGLTAAAVTAFFVLR